MQNRCPHLRRASAELGAWTGQDFPPPAREEGRLQKWSTTNHRLTHARGLLTRVSKRSGALGERSLNRGSKRALNRLSARALEHLLELTDQTLS